MLNIPKTGEIWAAFLCDPTGTNYKIRPVLVLDRFEDKNGDFAGCGVLGITKNIEGRPNLEFVIKADRSNGLTVDSAVKYAWPEDVAVKHLKTKMGFVTRQQFQSIIDGLNAYENNLPE